MILKRISILNYKNLEEVELGFSAKLNCFFGLNGMGKTNRWMQCISYPSVKVPAIRLIRRIFVMNKTSLSSRVSMKRRTELLKRFIVE